MLDSEPGRAGSVFLEIVEKVLCARACHTCDKKCARAYAVVERKELDLDGV